MRTLADDLNAALARVLAYMGALAAITIAGAELIKAPRGTVAAATQSQPAWIEVGRPHAAFALAMSEFGEAEFRYGISRHEAAGGRKDVMRWGAMDGGSAAAMVEIYRPGDELARFSDAADTIVARLGQIELAETPTAAETIDTKFGPVDLIDFAPASPGGSRRCLGFARGFGDPRLQIVGWYCNAGPEIVERAVVACMLDRLTLMSAGSDPKVAELFAHAELKRTFCGHKSQIMAATPRRGDWIAGTIPAPKLRGRLAAR